MAEKTFHSLTLPGQETARVPLTAVEFNTSTAYKVKDYCTYQGKLYRCTVAHAAGAWNASHFVETNMGAELDRKLDIPPSQASAPANPRVGDLWIDNDENSPIYNVDAAPTLGSTNAVQSGGTKTALNAVDSRKVEHGCITGDFSASVDYRVGDLVFYATTANGITTRTLYRCTTAHNAAAWNATHFTATTLEVELQRVRDNEADTDMIGDLFGAKTTYAVGDYCIYNDNLYRCIQAVDNSGVATPAFDPDDWTQVALANDVSNLNRQTSDVKNVLIQYNSVNLLPRGVDYTQSGITWEWDADGKCRVQGSTSSSAAFNFMIGAVGAPVPLPTGFVPGKTYNVQYSSANVRLRFTPYNGSTSLGNYDFYNDGTFSLPENATAINVLLRVNSSHTVDETVNPIMLSAESNEDIEADLRLVEQVADSALKTIVPKDSVAANDDFNDYTSPGEYAVNTQEIANTVANMPLARSGKLIVSNTSSKSTCVQIYIANATGLMNSVGIYVRYYNGTYFKEWQEITQGSTITALQQEIASRFNLSPITDDAVESGDDLNDYVQPGQWRIGTTVIGRSLLNKPQQFDTTGLLTVFNTHNSNHVYQVLATNGYTEIWLRHIMIDSGRFDEWRTITNIPTIAQQYAWQNSDFLLHVPSEENDEMIASLGEIGVTIGNSTAWGDHPGGFRTISSDVVYALWDALQAKYPQYIDAGETIGYSIDTSGANYKPVKAYYIHPKLTYGSNVDITYDNLPTIYITAGTHGVEASPCWNLYAMFRRAFMTGTIYSEFLKGKKYRIVPCLDRWSYDYYRRYLAAAYNADRSQKVPDEDLPLYDANRQCVCTDNTNPSYSTLTIPTYASEAKALTDYMQVHGFANNPKDCYIDLHNCSYSLGYFTAEKISTRSQFNVMIDELAKIWYANTTWTNGDPVDYYNTSTIDHTTLHGKICARENVEESYAWFFGKAYDPKASALLEVQEYDESSCAPYAIAKGLDVTYRWFREMLS